MKKYNVNKTFKKTLVFTGYFSANSLWTVLLIQSIRYRD